MPSSGEHEELARVIAEALDNGEHETTTLDLHDIRRLAIDLLRAGYSRPAGWRPISEAPRDGTWIQVYWLTMRMTFYPAVVFWDEGWQLANDYMKDYGEVFPTHWQPLPEIPQKQKP